MRLNQQRPMIQYEESLAQSSGTRAVINLSAPAIAHFRKRTIAFPYGQSDRGGC
jgi:hypothetical protein